MAEKEQFELEPYGNNNTKRLTIPEAEEILYKPYKCLDFGFVRLMDYMGGDSSIVQAARVSYGAGTTKLRGDIGLIRYLMRHRHTTPFEQVELKFHAKMPIFVARQWIRHRTANVNEYSGRYSEMPDEFYVPDKDELRIQSKRNKQGRGELIPQEKQIEVLEILKNINSVGYSGYKKLLEMGLARELARIGLSVSNYTQWYWKIDLHNLFHFLSLRLDEHAQKEIKVYAEKMAEITRKVVPIAYSAFEDYNLNATHFSSLESRVVSDLLRKGDVEEAIYDINRIVEQAPPKSIEVIYRDILWGKGELTEFKEKLEKLVK